MGSVGEASSVERPGNGVKVGTAQVTTSSAVARRSTRDASLARLVARKAATWANAARRPLGVEQPDGQAVHLARDAVAHRAIAPGFPPVSRSRSAGASAISSPRRPALTKTSGHSSALASSTVGSAFRCPSGLIPPTT